MFDIVSHVEQARNRTWARIQSTPVTWSVHGDGGTFTVPREEASEVVSASHANGESLELSKPINELVLAYLAHHGYARTARAFKTQCDRRSNVGPTQSVAPPVEDHTMAMETDREVPAFASLLTVPVASSSTEAARIDSGLGAADAAIMQNDTLRRQKIVRSIVEGDVDTALEETRTNYPGVLERDGGIILFKLRCRKFVELVLEAAVAWRKVKELEAMTNGSVSNGTTTVTDGEHMDVDDDSRFNGTVLNGASSTPTTHLSSKVRAKMPVPSASSSKIPSQIALEHALTNGQSLQADYKSDSRPEVQGIYKRTLSLVAYDDPLSDDPSVPEAVRAMAGQAARDQLAEEVNCAILGALSHSTCLRR